MKIITADIPQETYDFLNKYGTDGGIVEKAVINGTPIPDNATNGDMIKAMFPDIKIHEHKKTDICDAYIQIDIWDFSICVFKDWWDEPYKGVE